MQLHCSGSMVRPVWFLLSLRGRYIIGYACTLSVTINPLGADLASSTAPKGGGQEALNKTSHATPLSRFATNGGEKCGLGLCLDSPYQSTTW